MEPECLRTPASDGGTVEVDSGGLARPAELEKAYATIRLFPLDLGNGFAMAGHYAAAFARVRPSFAATSSADNGSESR
jgi:hypothetical protein